MVQNIAIVYFSGTGNTKAVSKLLVKDLEKRVNVNLVNVEQIIKGKQDFNPLEYDMIGLAYPMHGFDLPRVMYQFVNTLPKIEGKKTFIYFTGGGPAYLNSISTLLVKKKLRRKGYEPFYERIFYMPSNFLVRYPDEVSKQLYNAVIPKVSKMANDLLNEKSRLRKDRYIIRILFSWLFFFEKLGWRFIGRDFKTTKACSNCKKCINLCPRANIVFTRNKIRFRWNCAGCYRCVYACPENAIKGRFFNFLILKEGYNIKQIINNDEFEGDYISDETKGYYGIFKKYLTEIDT